MSVGKPMEIDNDFKRLIIYGAIDQIHSCYLSNPGQYRKQCKLAIVILRRFDLSLTKNE